MPSFRSRRNKPEAEPSSPAPAATPAVAPVAPRWPAFPPPHHIGQLTPTFQARLAEAARVASPEQCDWYHTAELRDGTVINGAWDLRGGEVAYLGGQDVAGKRVLELGPATGHLTFWMEEHGADVVGFDAGFDTCIDLMPIPGEDHVHRRQAAMQAIDLVQRSWWYLHADRQSAAKAVYGNIYDLPLDLGEFDVSVFGAILLHLRDPFRALAEASVRTTSTMIVTDVLHDEDTPLDANVMRPDPLGDPAHTTNWWAVYPGAVVAMLKRLGFGDVEVTTHRQRHHIGHRLDDEATEMSMYTVVGRRA